MAFEVPPLPYEYNALAPTIDEQTMHLHHDKHHAAYVNNLNAAIEKHPEVGQKSIEDILRNINSVPEDIRTAVRNNGGGHANHTLFWEIMTPGGSKAPTGALLDAINSTFGSVDAFKEKFNSNGATRFGSGWTWLVKKQDSSLDAISSPNQDSPLMDGLVPILGNDVWEHAYYLTYQNRRPDYLKAWWDVVNWDKVAERFGG